MAAIDYFNAMQGVSERKDAAALQDIHIQQQRFDNILQNFAQRRQQQQQFDANKEIQIKDLSMREKAMELQSQYQRGSLDLQSVNIGLAKTRLEQEQQGSMGAAVFQSMVQGKSPEEILKVQAPEGLSGRELTGFMDAKRVAESGVQVQSYMSEIDALKKQDLNTQGEILKSDFSTLSELRKSRILDKMGIPVTADLLELSKSPQASQIIQEGTRRLDAQKTSELIQKAVDLGQQVDLTGIFDENGYVNTAPTTKSKLGSMAAYVDSTLKASSRRAAGELTDVEKAQIDADTAEQKALSPTAFLPEDKEEIKQISARTKAKLATRPGGFPTPPPSAVAPQSGSGKAMVRDPKTGLWNYATTP